jgi:MSHA biogenesis protein MshL
VSIIRTTALLLTACAAWLGGCATPVMKPSETHIQAEPAAPPGAIPPPVQMSTALPKPKPLQRPETYSVVVNNVKVQELLFSLARDARLNVDIHPGISGTVTLNAIDQTLPQLLSRIARQVDMRWELDGPNLVVMPDTPYLRLYRIDYVNMERLSSSTVGVSSQITSGTGGAGGGAAGGTGGNTSSTTLRNVSDNKFWDTLIKNIEEILRETDRIFPTTAASSAAPLAAPFAVPPGAPGTAPPASPGAVAPVPSVSFREAAAVIANRETGVISIRASSKQHERIQEFLDQVMASARRQVLIEATIVEVQLSNRFQQGIDWSLLRRGPAGLSLSQSSAGSPANITTNFFVASIADPNSRLGNLSATIRLLETFGNVRVLSSPKLSVLNNQTAILKVVDEIVYFNVQASTTAAGTTGNILQSITTTAQTAPIGFIMNVTPQISEGDIVLLNLRPSLTRVVSFVADPNPLLVVPNLIPQIQRREMESLIKVNSGQIAVMGGLIQDSLNDTEDGIPGVNRTPAAVLFSQRNLNNVKSELVVFLRPLVVRDPSIDGDYRAFRTYVPDEAFMSRPNPARPQILRGGSQR